MNYQLAKIQRVAADLEKLEKRAAYAEFRYLLWRHGHLLPDNLRKRLQEEVDRLDPRPD